MNLLIQINSVEPVESASYYDSAEERAKIVCLVLLQGNGEQLISKVYPEVECIVALKPTQSTSLKACIPFEEGTDF